MQEPRDDNMLCKSKNKKYHGGLCYVNAAVRGRVVQAIFQMWEGARILSDYVGSCTLCQFFNVGMTGKVGRSCVED